MTRILVVEDDRAISQALCLVLRSEGYEVAVADTGPDALSQFGSDGADMVLLDWILPELPGLEVCRRLRQTSNVPVIMVTAKDSEIDKVVALEMGADDYVTKPFSSRELIARIRAVLRGRGSLEQVPLNILEAGPVRMDVEEHLTLVNGKEVYFPLKEFELLRFLLQNVGRVLTKQQILDQVWGADHFGDGKTVDVHMRRLRIKIESDPGRPRHLLTVRGVGYKFQR
ncbi:response regulator transcription factor [Streptomyces sp. MI02-7b]|uniref:response regulator transcription factor n=1 Tax=Streptomyces sp. MI02-7b TaxID=462941 RepID=UPI0029A611E8|nr:response regulator transcription factor [Streptomyces sp. MI02-7b]MDX3070786.1 response regulator transcription factor [Streptomyces sp. MI02-7b]